MKLRDRLTLTFTLVTALALLASFVVTYFLVERDELRDLDRSLLVQASHAASTALQRGPDDPRMLEGAGEAIEPPAIIVRYAALYDRSGTLVRTTNSFGSAPSALDTIVRVNEIKPTSGFDLDVGIDRPELGGKQPQCRLRKQQRCRDTQTASRRRKTIPCRGYRVGDLVHRSLRSAEQ